MQLPSRFSLSPREPTLRLTRGGPGRDSRRAISTVRSGAAPRADLKLGASRRQQLTRTGLARISQMESLDTWEFPVSGGLVVSKAGLRGLCILNSTAAEIWEYGRGNESPSSIAAFLSERYDVPFERALTDVLNCREQWRLMLTAERAGRMPVRLPPSPSSFHQTYSYNGCGFSVGLSTPELVAEIEPRLRSLLSNREPSAVEFSMIVSDCGEWVHIHSGQEFISAEASVPAARAVLLQEIVRRAAKPPREWLAVIHAAACGNETECVVFPGASHSGKTTLAAMLMRAGLTFYSDDSVAIDKDGLRVHSMPFGLAIREGSWGLLESNIEGFDRAPVFDRYGGPVRFFYPPAKARAARVAAFVFPSYRPDSEFSIERLTTFDALIKLKESGFWLENTRTGTCAFIDMVETAECYAMLYSDTRDAAAFVRGLLNVSGLTEFPAGMTAC